MDLEEIRTRVARIEANRDDDETAHSQEDDLYTDVLRAIADGAPNASELAREALRTVDIDFARWCAWPHETARQEDAPSAGLFA